MQIRESRPDSSYSGSNVIYTQKDAYLGLFRFEVGQNATSVTFKPYINRVYGSGSMTVYAIDNSWPERSTWNNTSAQRAACTGTPLATASITSEGQRISVPLPVSNVDANGFLNICVSTSDESTQIRIASNEDAAGNVPQLDVVRFEEEVEPSGPVESARTIFSIRDRSITDASSWAMSQATDGIRWTNQDRTNQAAQMYAIGPNGQTVATVNLTGPGVTHVDTESAASAMLNGVPYVYLGDTGGNKDRRNEIYVHRFVEPTLDLQTENQVLSRAAETWTFTYPAADVKSTRTIGPDAETLLVNPSTGQIYIVVKSSVGLPSGTTAWGIYAAPAGAANTPGSYALTKIATTSVKFTEGAWSQDGSVIALRTYDNVYLYSVQNGDLASALQSTPQIITPPRQQQGEGIAFSADGKAVELSTEQHNGQQAPVVRQPLPTAYQVSPLNI